MPRPGRIALLVLWGFGVVFGLAACGGQGARQHTRPLVGHTTLNIYASLPLRGVWAAQGTAVADGVKLALSGAGGAAGRWRVRLRLLDDSGGAAQVARNARTASTNPATVYYIGELDSASSEISAPLLNAAGVAQLSPLSTAMSARSGSLDPTGRPTFFRLAPSDATQAAVQLEQLSRAHCRRVAVVHDGSVEGGFLAAELEARRGQFGVRIAHDESLTAPGALAAGTKAQGDDCVVFAGAATPAAVAFLIDLSSVGRLRLVLGSYGVCTASVTAALPPGIRGPFRCTLPAGNLGASRVGRAFLAAYGAAYGVSPPDALAAYGYEAMRLGLDTIAALGSHGDDKAAVRAALVGLRSRQSVLGAYGFDRDGSSTLGTYGLYRIGKNGAPVFAEGLRP